MRIAFENTKNDINISGNAINTKKTVNITDMFFIYPDFAFNNETQFATESVWKLGIGAGYIIPIHDIYEVDDQSQDVVYGTSLFGYEYKKHGGKKRLSFRTNPDMEIAKDMVDYSDQYYHVCFADRNKNLYGRLSGSQVLGIDTDMISIELPRFGSVPMWTTIRVELSDISDLYMANVDFKPWELINIPVEVTNPSQSATTNITFDVTDIQCSVGIEGLLTSEIVITDTINGTIAHQTFTDNGDGSYTIASASDIFHGTITITSEDYNGSGLYSFTVPQYNPNQYDNSQYNVT